MKISQNVKIYHIIIFPISHIFLAPEFQFLHLIILVKLWMETKLDKFMNIEPKMVSQKI